MMAFWQGLGLWNWLIAGLILFGLELVIPGVFLLWFGCAALTTALICAIFLNFQDLFATWQVQIILFCLWSVIFVLIGRYLTSRHHKQTDNPFLNRRIEAMIGQVATLEEPIENGQGRIRFGDTLWRVHGLDLPTGRKVRLIGFDAGAFLVEEVRS